MSRDEQYQNLLDRTDPNSNFERQVLQEIYAQQLKLPDAAQYFISEANIKPDFVYLAENLSFVKKRVRLPYHWNGQNYDILVKRAIVNCF